MWFKKNKGKLIAGVAVLAILVAAFYFGGNAPGSKGWSVKKPPVTAENELNENDPKQGGEILTPNTGEEDNKTQGSQSGELSGTNDNDQEPSGAEQEVTPPENQGGQQKVTPPENSDKDPSGAEASTGGEASTGSEVSTGGEAAQSGDSATGGDPAPSGDSSSSGGTASGMIIDPKTGKDKYLTDPVPEGKPLPVEPQDVKIGTQAYSCTLSISCENILNNMDFCDPEKRELVPEDGWILKPTVVTFYEGESVFDVLRRTCKQLKIHMEYENTPIYNSAYIEGIHNLYEFDVGDLSGWMYKVNEWFPNYGCSRYALKDGDIICWVYTCDLGYDVGGGYATGNK